MEKIILKSNFIVPTICHKQEHYLLSPNRDGIRRKAKLWKFKPGDLVYVRGFGNELTFYVVEKYIGQTWPMYICEDTLNKKCIIAQIMMSYSPIYDK
jgi:hypothetical protein